MRRLLIPFLALWLLIPGLALAAAATQVSGGGWNLDADDDVTDTVQCEAGRNMRVTATAVSGQALSSGDSLFLQLLGDLDGNPVTLQTWTSTDMPVDQVHACTGRNRNYRVILDDDNNSSDVNVELWVYD